MSESTSTRPLLLDVLDACAALGIGRSKFYELVAAGRIRTVTIGKRRMVAPADLKEYVERLRSEAAAS